ncbi:MAG: hypothetical protein H6728_10485 [Myxococcales bacterium]|nr:hypothetical protein [Myxococcales bacterium]MCB9643485.1 hypothetical protein [Myxococcales bacterium]
MVRKPTQRLIPWRLLLLGLFVLLGNSTVGCITIITECLEDIHCSNAQNRPFCVVGRCRECRNDKDCTPGMRCEFWACRPDPRGSFATCGDSTCDPQENCRTCPADCGACTSVTCGNQKCDVGENCRTCPNDCGPCSQTCQDNVCQDTETCITCPDDCGPCKAQCGNGVCENSEDCTSCEADCGKCATSCGNGQCEITENCQTCPNDCGKCADSCGDTICQENEDCRNCPTDCGKCATSCGNGKCETGEDCNTCEADCGKCQAQCGDGTCQSTETCQTCPQDCGKCPPTCGNLTCEDSEDCKTCPQDCGECPASCGDGKCGPNEDCRTCETDCGKCAPKCGDGICSADEGCKLCPDDCGKCAPNCGNGKCEPGETCNNCDADCGKCAPSCGNKICDATETCDSCPDDCGKCPVQCGNGVCDATETCTTCEKDCGPCPDKCGDGICGPTETCTGCAVDCKTCAGQRCTEDADCGTGYVCLDPGYNNPQKYKYCFQSCSNNPLLCMNNTDGRTHCTPVTSSLRVCLRDAKETETCGEKSRFQWRCLDDPPLYCNSATSVCQKPTIQVNIGDDCDIPPYTRQPPRLCDTEKKLICDPNTKKCITATLNDEGKECDPTGLILGQKILCSGVQICVDFGPFGQRCHIPCGSNNACPHNAELQCQEISFAPGTPKVCMDLQCTEDKDCVFGDYVCSGNAGTSSVCRPPGPIGPLSFGLGCNTDPALHKTAGCQSGLFCVPYSLNSQQGICTQDCTVNSGTCKTLTSLEGTFITQCETNVLGFKSCSIACHANTLKCPSGMTCDNGRCLP